MSNTSNPASKEVLELTGQLEQVLKTAKPLSLLEKDLVKERLRNIYSLVDGLVTMNEAPSGNPRDTANSENQKLDQSGQEESIRSEVMATLFSNKNRDIREAEISIEATEVNIQTRHHATGNEDRKAAPVSLEVEVATPNVNMGTTTEPQHKKSDSPVVEPDTLAKQYKASETVADKIGKAESGGFRLEDKLKHQPLGDLRQSIGINERFLFTNAFFGGNQQEYLQFIDRINLLHDFEEAFAFTREAIRNGTSTPGHAEAMEHFEELLRRRFKP